MATAVVAMLWLLLWPLSAEATEESQPDLVGSPDSRVGAPWRLAKAGGSEPLFPGTVLECPGRWRWWRNADGLQVAVTVWSCERAQDAAVAAWGLLMQQRTVSEVVALEAPPYSHALTTKDGSRPDGEPGTVEILFAQSRFVVVTHSTVPADPLRARELAAAIGSQQSTLLPGPAAELRQPDSDLAGKVASALVTAFTIFIMPLRLIRHPILQRYQVRVRDPRWVDVTSTARRLKWSLRLRSLARLLFLLCVLSVVLNGFMVRVLVLLAVTAMLGWIRPLGQVKLWRARRVNGPLPSAERRTWVAPVLSIFGTTCAVAGLGLLVLAGVLDASGFDQSPLMVAGRLDPRYMVAVHGTRYSTAAALLTVMPFKTLLQVSMLLAFGLLAAAALTRRMARRLLMRNARHALAHDTRPPVLYLRNFGDDRLKMPTSAVGRTSLLERLSPLKLQPFEEVLVRHLHGLGPVVALAHPSTRLPAIGAAKLTLPNDSWQQQVVEWAERAVAIVVAATPTTVNAGLEWELQYLAAAAPDRPILLVLGPHKQRDLLPRWNLFVSVAQRFPRFAELTSYLHRHSGAHVMLLHPQQGWLTWGARVRSEWTYAVAITMATELLQGGRGAQAGRSGRASTPRTWLPIAATAIPPPRRLLRRRWIAHIITERCRPPDAGAVTSRRRSSRRIIAEMGQRVARGEPVAPMYGPLGLAWLRHQAEVAEQLVAARTGAPPPTP